MTPSLPAWWQRLAERAAQPPLRPRRSLWIAGAPSPIGSIEPALAERMRAAGLPLHAHRGDAAGGNAAERLAGAPDAALAGVARWLHAQGLAGAWRDELLAVTDARGAARAVVERAAVRPLGIATFAVHLIGLGPDDGGDGVWVQQRALDKATDPGQWDTLVGGLVAAGETPRDALERETWEEAGLRLAELHALRPAGRTLTIRRPVREGYLVEHIDTFEARLPRGAAPRNQDGEVERFECLPPAMLSARLAEGQFSLEAALMLSGWLRDRGRL